MSQIVSEPQRAANDENSVSVIIAAMNADDTIGRAVHSALAQPEVSQVIVVDDGSSDETPAAARAVDDGTDRLIVIELEKNKGPAGARNVALQRVNAAWFTILDADDFMDAGRIGRMLAAAGDVYEMVADDMFLVLEGDEGGQRTRLWDRDLDNGAIPLTLDYFVRANLPEQGRHRRELGFIKPLIRTERMRSLGLKYDEGMRLNEDVDLYCRLLAARTPALLTPPLGYVAVRRPNSLSANHHHETLRAVYNSAVDLLALPGLDGEEKAALSQYRAMNSRRYRWPWLIHAVKTKKLNEVAACFATSPDVAAHLIGKLFETGLGKISSTANKSSA